MNCLLMDVKSAKLLVNLCFQRSCTNVDVNQCKIWISLILPQFRQFGFMSLSLKYIFFSFFFWGKTLICEVKCGTR